MVFTGYLEAPYAASLNPSGDFSVELWAQSSGLIAQYASLVTSRSDNLRGYTLYITETNQLQFWLGDGAAWQTVNGPQLTVGALSHLVATYSASAQTMSLYVNGVLAGSKTGVVGLANQTKPFRIAAGATEADAKSFYYGGLDNLAVYPSVLSASTVQQHFVTGTTP
jgi:hypothetical protein